MGRRLLMTAATVALPACTALLGANDPIEIVGAEAGADTGGSDVADVHDGSSDVNVPDVRVGTDGSTDVCADGCSACEPDTGSCPAPSCAAGGEGQTNCGGGSESCCTSLEVTGGTYYRTYANDGGGATGTADPATVSTFRLDEYEVTVGRFRQFVNAWSTGWTPPAGSGKHAHLNGGQGLSNSGGAGTFETGWVVSDDTSISPTDTHLSCDPDYATWTSTAGANEKRPINCVSWWEAYAFCIWDGGFLPSEAEWEYAAAGGSQQREYPWGSAAPGNENQYAIVGCYYPDSSGLCSGVTNIAPAGTPPLGGGNWGQLDLTGSIAEWVLDWYENYTDPCTDCAYLVSTSNRIYRGGIFNSAASLYLPPDRPFDAPSRRASVVGFRCARIP